jgi:hypothetical protein
MSAARHILIEESLHRSRCCRWRASHQLAGLWTSDPSAQGSRRVLWMKVQLMYLGLELGNDSIKLPLDPVAGIFGSGF